MFDAATGKLSVATSDASNTFHVWSAEALANSQWNSLYLGFIPVYAPHDDAYDVLGFHDPIPQPGSQGSPAQASGHLNVIPHHTLYIQSSLDGQNDSVDPMGSSSVIRTVCLDRAIGSYIHDRNSLPFDYVSVSKGMIRQLEFRLTDWRGRPVPLTNSWSFSIIFVPENEI